VKKIFFVRAYFSRLPYIVFFSSKISGDKKVSDLRRRVKQLRIQNSPTEISVSSQLGSIATERGTTNILFLIFASVAFRLHQLRPAICVLGDIRLNTLSLCEK